MPTLRIGRLPYTRPFATGGIEKRLAPPYPPPRINTLELLEADMKRKTMEPIENGNALPNNQIEKIKNIIAAITSENPELLNSIVDIPIENPDIFWKSVEEIQNKINYNGDDLRQHMRIMPTSDGNLGMIQVFLDSNTTGKRDILLILFTKEVDGDMKIFLGSIFDKSVYCPIINDPTERFD